MTESTTPLVGGGQMAADDWQADSDFDQEIVRLAGLSMAAYEVERRTIAKQLDVRASVLDMLVSSAKKENGADDDGKQGQKLRLPEIEPWPESVDGRELIERLQDAITQYVVLTDHEALACALWILHAHAHDWFFISPTLHVSSPEKQCGKSTLLLVLGPMVPRHLPTENITAAALFRTIELVRPTLFIDEADSFIGNSDELRGVLNSSHLKGGGSIRTVGDDYEPRLFSAWCPVVIAGIGRMPATLEDRSVQIQLSRRKAS
jgi:putative DNA primase/helicase